MGDPDSKTGNGLFGLYRGEVIENNDSEEEHSHLAKIKVRVPQVYGDIDDEALPWAEPCIIGGYGRHTSEEDEITDSRFGLLYIPPIGSSVWVMFEHGNAQRPVYMGGWLGETEDEESEIGDESRYAEPFTQEDDQYPKIICIKSPYVEKGMWIRFISDSKLEILIKEDCSIVFDEEEKKINILGTGYDIELEAIEKTVAGVIAGGNVSIKGKNITIEAEEDIQILSETEITVRALKVDSTTGENVYTGKVSIDSGEETKVKSITAIRGTAPAASGFEFHEPPAEST